MPHPTAFPELNDVLAQFAAGLSRLLGPELLALYLTGSFALGDADEGSDVDFLAVTRQLLTPEQQEAVQSLHRTLFDLPVPWAQHLEGSYIPAALLRGPRSGTPIPYLDNGSRTLELSEHDTTLVVRWVTREHGVALLGPPPLERIEPVEPDELRAEVRGKVQEWETFLHTDRDGLSNGWIQPYAALSVARMLHTLQTGQVHSKRAAVAWSRESAPRWTPLLERAWEQHPRQFLNFFQPADAADVALTEQFIRYALEQTMDASR